MIEERYGRITYDGIVVRFQNGVPVVYGTRAAAIKACRGSEAPVRIILTITTEDLDDGKRAADPR